LMHDQFSATLLFMREGYEDVGLTGVQGLLVRAVVLFAGTAATLALLVITPKGRYWWTAIARQSLTVYLLHAAILRPFKGGEFLESITDPLPTRSEERRVGKEYRHRCSAYHGICNMLVE